MKKMAELVCINAQCSFCFQIVWCINFCLIINFIDNNKTTKNQNKTKQLPQQKQNQVKQYITKKHFFS